MIGRSVGRGPATDSSGACKDPRPAPVCHDGGDQDAGKHRYTSLPHTSEAVPAGQKSTFLHVVSAPHFGVEELEVERDDVLEQLVLDRQLTLVRHCDLNQSIAFGVCNQLLP